MKTNKLRIAVVALAVSAALAMSPSMVLAAGEANSGITGSVYIAPGKSGVYTVTATNTSTGLTREVSADSSGNFRFSQLPVGEYQVEVKENGATVAKETVRVSLGSNAVARFDLSAGDVERVEIIGGRISLVDVTTSDSGLVVTEADIDAMPIARNLTSVALLAPGTVPGESRFGNLASFGGSSVAENACYINGLEVTDTRQGLGCGSVPFEFYKEFQVKTGGYSSAFGRATGGLINTVTKSGGNEWDFAFTANYEPTSLAERGNISRATGGTGANTLGAFRDFSQNETDFYDYTISAGGPIIKDKLFVYALVNPRNFESTFSSVSGNASRTATNRINYDEATGADNTFWGAKVDWDISDRHRLSAFGYSDRRDITRTTQSYNPNTGVTSGTPSETILMRGGEATSISYTGNITDDLTISAMWGDIHTEFNNEPANTTCPLVSDSRTGLPAFTPIVGCGPGTALGTNFDDNTQKRFDIDWVIGDHNIRAGLDYQDRESEQTSYPIGGATYEYLRLAPTGSIQIVGNPYTNNTSAPIDYVAARSFTGGGPFRSEMEAWYIEDSWQIMDNLVITAGIRNDALTNYGTTGSVFADFQDSLAPRFGVSWDPTGDGTSKLYMTWGRFFLPVPNNTNYRVASGISDSTTYYLFTGSNPADGTPTGTTPVNGTVENSTNTNSLPVFYPIEMTQAAEADPFHKEELTVGYDFEVAEGYRGSARVILRDTPTALDDYCGDLAPHCVLINPGKGGTWGVDLDHDGVMDPNSYQFHTAEQIGIPKAENKYEAVQLQLDHRSSDMFYSFIYTWSHSYGNFEGAVKSDIAQADAGITQDFDFPALMDGAYGDQANDREHVFKFYGNYKLSDQWSVGWNSLLSSGRPLSTFGRGYPNLDPHIYGSYGDTFTIYTGQCPDGNGNLTCDQSEKIYRYTNRGDAGRTPWTFNLDFNLSYDFSVGNVDMKAILSVFNILNAQEVTASNEHYESSEGTRNQYYGSAYTYQTPRWTRIGFEARF